MKCEKCNGAGFFRDYDHDQDDIAFCDCAWGKLAERRWSQFKLVIWILMAAFLGWQLCIMFGRK